MPKRKLIWDEDKIDRFIKKGRGQGEGASYKPWLTTHDVSSIGRKHRLRGWKTNRGHYFLSDLEENIFYYFNWNDNVVDIRERFPVLDRKKTMEIAEEYQIKYPIDPQTKTPLVICTDFLITIKEKNQDILLARTAIPYKRLENERQLDKFKLEYLYWRNQGVNWGIITDYDIPKVIIDNIRWVFKAYWLNNPSKETNELIEILKRSFQTDIKTGTLASFLTKLDEDYNQEPGTFLDLTKHLIAHKVLKVDFHKKVTPSLPVSDFIVAPTMIRIGDNQYVER